MHPCRILPQDITCPGGNSSWEKVEVRNGTRRCEDQKDMCNLPGQMCKFLCDAYNLKLQQPAWAILYMTSWLLIISAVSCPENSLCAPYGPGFFECSCVDNYHGYKCLREVSPANSRSVIDVSCCWFEYSLHWNFFDCFKHCTYFPCQQGEFPALQVFGPLGASTVVISFLLWVTQRRKVTTVWGRASGCSFNWHNLSWSWLFWKGKRWHDVWVLMTSGFF